MKHGASGYHDGCRCDTCRIEAMTKQREIRRRRKEHREPEEITSGYGKFEQLQLPLDPVLRLLEMKGVSAQALGERRCRVLQRAKKRGTVPLWLADDLTGQFGETQILTWMLEAVGR